MMYDVIIIGGGPAGLAAMAYALDKRLDALLVGSHIRGKAGVHQQVKGQQAPTVLLGEEAVSECLRRIEMYPNRIVTDVVTEVQKEVSFFTVLSKQTQWQSRAVIVATGALPTLLGIPNERELVGHGLGYSSTTHARL